MGFFSSLGSALSSLGGALGISNTATKLMVGVLGRLNPVIGTVLTVIDIASTVLSIAKKLGLFDAAEKVEDLGDKAIQAADKGIKPENYKTYEEYVEAIRNFEVDPEKSKEIKEYDKLERGAQVALGLTMEKFGSGIGELLVEFSKRPDLWVAGTERIPSYIDYLKNNDVPVKPLQDYMAQKSILLTDKKDIEGMVRAVEKAINPQVSEDKISDIMRSLRVPSE